MSPKESRTGNSSKPSTQSTSSPAKVSPQSAWIEFRNSFHEDAQTSQAMSISLEEVMASMMSREDWMKIIGDGDRRDKAFEELRKMNSAYDKNFDDEKEWESQIAEALADNKSKIEPPKQESMYIDKGNGYKNTLKIIETRKTKVIKRCRELLAERARFDLPDPPEDIAPMGADQRATFRANIQEELDDHAKELANLALMTIESQKNIEQFGKTLAVLRRLMYSPQAREAYRPQESQEAESSTTGDKGKGTE